MKKLSGFMVIVAAIGMIVASCGKGYNANIKLKSDVDSAFYAIGVLQGSGLRENFKSLPGLDATDNYDALLTALVTAINDKTSQLKMTPEEAQMYIQTFLANAQVQVAEKAKTDEMAFFAANGSKPGVITTESGLQYKILTTGTGEKPTLESIVVMHYTGKLLDGTVFESSVTRGEPLTMPVGQFIEGWKEVLQLMPVGSKYQVWIPFDMAYGAQGGGMIKPYSTLEFEMELLGIQE